MLCWIIWRAKHSPTHFEHLTVLLFVSLYTLLQAVIFAPEPANLTNLIALILRSLYGLGPYRCYRFDGHQGIRL